MNQELQEKIDFKHNLKTYFGLAKPYKAIFILTILIIVISELANLAPKYLFKIIIDQGTEFSTGLVSQSEFVNVLIIVAVVFTLASIISAVGHWKKTDLLIRLDGNITLDLRRKFFNHLVQLSHRFHTSNKTGSLISKLTRGAKAIDGINHFFLFNFVPVVMQFLIIGVSILYFDLLTAISILITSIVFLTFSFFMLNRQQVAGVEANAAEDREKGFIGDILANIDSIKYYAKEVLIDKRQKVLAKDARDKMLVYDGYFRTLEAGQIFILAIGSFFVVFFPILRFLQGEITVGTLAFIYTAYGGLLIPLYGFIWGFRGFYRSMIDFQALFKYAKLENEIKDKPGAKKLKAKEGKISFKEVKFAYHERDVIKSLDLEINPGEKVALVGHSGSGKTTLVKLLYRLYDIQSGSIKVDGSDIKDVKQTSLRSELSIVPQEAILFDDTIYNNIAFSNPSASKNQVKRAIRFAQLGEFIESLPSKEKTIVGERGVKLSGGEKQRVSIARALLANKRILVLDEATSALDSKTEFEIQKALKELMKGRTSIIIAHRLSTIMSADKIVVMDKGKIVQIGKHRDLIKKSGVYRELWDLQKGGYIEE